jgi:probable HAF family extracellular repeat protein
MRRLLLVVAGVLASVGFGAATATSADRTWTITDLGAGDWSYALAINNHGQIVGQSADHGAFLWQNGGLIDLSLGFGSTAWDINDRGVVVGNYLSGGSTHGFVWRNGVVTDLGDLGFFGSLTGINRRGQIVGYRYSASGRPYSSFVWEDGTFTDLGDLGGGYTTAQAINDRGEVVGSSATADGVFHAFEWRDGVMTDLGSGEASDINNHGQISGWSLLHAVMWKDGAKTILGDGYGRGINKHGDVVGEREVFVQPNFVYHGMLWHDGVETDLGTLGGFTAVHAINDRGDAVGTSGLPASGPQRAVLFSRR